jgi:hypothetical protein
MFDDYGNKTRIHKELWGILDNIGKESEEVWQYGLKKNRKPTLTDSQCVPSA